MSGTPGISIDCFRRDPPSTRIRIDRPQHAARVFAGKTPDEVLAVLPLLFSVCGTAQSAAAWHALCAAGGRATDPVVAAAHGVLVHMEIAREHLWRIVIDWPRFTQLPVKHALLADAERIVKGVRTGLFHDNPFAPDTHPDVQREALEAELAAFDGLLERDILGLRPDDWLQLNTVEDLDRYTDSTRGAAAALIAELRGREWQTAAAAAPHYLPPLAADRLNDRLESQAADRFVERPDWDGAACETTPLCRQRHSGLLQSVLREHGPGLYARAVATVRELAATSVAVRDLLEGRSEPVISIAGEGGAAVAQIEAARGRLVHRVSLAGGTVESYRIVAPTEWNFHPDGTLPRAIATLDPKDAATLAVQADLLITLFDPCVAYSLEVH